MKPNQCHTGLGKLLKTQARFWPTTCHILHVLDGLASKIEHYMDLLSVRQKLVASNIANADTPGYKTRDIDFNAELQSAFSSATPNILDVEGLKTKNDGNNVSIDRESRLLSENAIRFNIAAQLLHGEIRTLKSAMEEGKS